MPLYEYEHDDGECTDGKTVLGPVRFEAMQPRTEAAITTCPKCGKPCHRVLSTFGVGGKEKQLLSDKNLGEKGFTKYVKAGDGTYEKTAGSGPDVITRG